MVSIYEDHYDEINAELQQMAAIAAAEESVPKKLYVGSGEDVRLFHWKDIEHHVES